MPKYLDMHGLETLTGDIENAYLKKNQRGAAGGVASLDSNGKVPTSQIPGGAGGTTDYDDLTDKPQINGVTLSGNKTSANLGIHDIPSGGTTGQVLAKSSDSNYAVQWVNQQGGSGGTTNYTDLDNKPKINGTTLSGNKTTANLGIHDVPSGGSAGQVLAKHSGTDHDVEWVTPADPASVIDDNAGPFSTDKTFSSSKLWSELGGKVDKTGAQFNDVSMNRVPNSTVGTKSIAIGTSADPNQGAIASGDNSVAVGTYVQATGNKAIAIGSTTQATGINATAIGGSATASGDFSFSHGSSTTAQGINSTAEGYGTTASGISTHAEGSQTFAVGDYSHSQGYGTRANGYASSVEGNGTVANGANSSVSGMYNVPDSYTNWPDWAPNTDYAAGDKVHFQDEESGETRGEYFVCNTSHTSGTEWITYSFYWDSDNGKMNYAQIVGNGSNYLQQSNAYTLDWNGNGSYAGDVTINKGTVDEVSVSELKTEINSTNNEVSPALVEKNLLNIETWTYRTNYGAENNRDGTYDLATNDYGSVFWKTTSEVPAGKYSMPGSPYGFTVVATSQSYTEDIVAKNETGNDMEFVNPTSQYLYLCLRLNTFPSTAFVFVPTISKKIVQNDKIESYYKNEMDDTIAKVRSENNEPALVFPWMTDVHLFSLVEQTFYKAVSNIKQFSKVCACDFILESGDLIEGENTPKANALGVAYNAISALHEIGLPVLHSNGNHDNNGYSSENEFNPKDVFGAFYNALKGATFNLNENGTDYYIDFENIGVRVISLNSCNRSISKTYGFGNSTASWLEATLNTDKYVIVITHVSPVETHVWNETEVTNGSSIKSALNTFVNNGGKLVVLTGHSHVDAEFISPYFEVTNVCQKFEQADISTTEYGKIKGMVDGIRNPARVSGTATDDAWTAVVFKPISEEIDLIRFGAGVDRYIHLKENHSLTLASKLTGVITWESTDSSIATVSGGVINIVSDGTCGILAKDESGNVEIWKWSPRDTSAEITDYDKVIWHENSSNPYELWNRENGAVTIKYEMDTPTNILYPAGIIPTNGSVIYAGGVILAIFDENEVFANYVTENEGGFDRWAQDESGTMTEFSRSWTLGSQYKYIQFTLDKRYLDDAYMYDKTSGQIWFAGKNTPYYGMKNVSEAQ